MNRVCLNTSLISTTDSTTQVSFQSCNLGNVNNVNKVSWFEGMFHLFLEQTS